MGYNCRIYQPEKERQIIEDIWKRNLPWVPEERFHWLYESSEAIIGIKTYILQKDDIPCGSVSFLSRDFSYEGKIVRGGMFLDILVDKGHRSVFPALSLIKSAINGARDSGLEFLFALPNEKAQPVFLRCGFQLIGQPVGYSRVVNIQDKLNKYLGNISFKNHISSFINFMMNTCVGFINYSFLQKIDNINKEFEQIQSHSISLPPNDDYMHPITSKEYVLWRYERNPIKEYQIFIVKIGIEEVSIIYFLESKILIIEDIIYSHKDFISKALFEFTKAMSNKDIISIYLNGSLPSDLQRQMRKSGFIKRPSNKKLLGINLCMEGSNITYIKKLSMFDGDMDL